MTDETANEAGAVVAAPAPAVAVGGELLPVAAPEAEAPPARTPRPTRIVEGVVNQRNSKGVVVGGTWFNWSKYTPVTLPGLGVRTRLTVDERNFICRVEYLDSPAMTGAAGVMAPRATASGRTASFLDVKLAVLQAAASFGSGQDWDPSIVLRTADQWLAWLEGQGA